MNRHFSSGLGTQLRQGLGTRLAGVRRALGLTQGRLARLVGCAPWVIGRCERGEHCPKVEVLVALRTALNVSLDYLLTGVPMQVKDPRLLKRLRAIEALSPDRFNELLRLIDRFLASGERR